MKSIKDQFHMDIFMVISKFLTKIFFRVNNDLEANVSLRINFMNDVKNKLYTTWRTLNIKFICLLRNQESLMDSHQKKLELEAEKKTGPKERVAFDRERDMKGTFSFLKL